MNFLKLFAPKSYRTATKPEIEQICNGCGSKGFGGWIVPDTMWGLDISEACNIHDWMYFEGDTIADKEEADRVLLNNLLRIIDYKSNACLKLLRKRRAMKYYLAVKYFGGPAFWADKNMPDDMLAEPFFVSSNHAWADFDHG